MLKNKIAVITGASRGIGRETAIEMAKQGADIGLIYASNSTAAEDTAQAIRDTGAGARIYQCDVSRFEDTKQTVNQIVSDFGTVDILVNNAGITRDKLVLSMKEQDFDSVVDTNLKGAFNMIKHLYPVFVKKRYGRIINISSVVGLSGNAGQANYSCAKAGIIGLTKSIAKELAARNVTCNAIAPGFIQTDMTAQLSDTMVESIKNNIPVKRLGTPQDVAYMAVFLASDMASYITGEIVKVDGGLYI